MTESSITELVARLRDAAGNSLSEALGSDVTIEVVGWVDSSSVDQESVERIATSDGNYTVLLDREGFAALGTPGGSGMAADATISAAYSTLVETAPDIDWPTLKFQSHTTADKTAAPARLLAITITTQKGTTCYAHFGPKEMVPRPVSAETRTVAPIDLPELGSNPAPSNGSPSLGLLEAVEVEVSVELGRRRMPLKELVNLTRGSVVELEKLVGEPLEVYANGRLIADGEAVVVDEQFGIRITNLMSAPATSPAH